MTGLRERKRKEAVEEECKGKEFEADERTEIYL